MSQDAQATPESRSLPAADSDLPAPSETAPAATPTAKPKRRMSKLRFLALAAGTLAFLLVFFVVAYTAFHFLESTRFCSSCHNMKPEVTAHDSSPHARTECGTCHVGPGAIAGIKAKLENARYVVLYPLNLYPRPIPSPIHSLRPVEVVCEQCHWPQKFYNDRLVVKSSYATDEANSLTRTQLLLRTGGGTRAEGLGRGIHWHIENPVTYIASDDKRQNIVWVQAQFQGSTIEYVAADANVTQEFISKAAKRTMDCVDCHNRATHTFTKPEDALDTALANGTIASDLPFIKREGLAVLDKTYGTEAEAAQAIAAVEDFYKTNYAALYSARQADIKAAVAGLQAIFDETQFPFMNVTWQTHTNNIGHIDFAGCFRCHDGKHISSGNQVIRLECNICHSLPQVAGPGKQLPALQLAAVKEPATHLSTSWLAEHRNKFDASCANCHTIDNPGGKDNSSFCSNSACHGAQLKFAGLNAPKVRELFGPAKSPSTGAPGQIPHPLGARTDCLLCHGAGKVQAFPANHSSFTMDVCTGCHKPSVPEAAAPSPTAAPTATAKPATAVPTIAPTPVVPSPTSAPTAAASPTSAPTAAATATKAPTPAPPTTGAAPSIPHDLTGRADCLLCHDTGKMKPFPADHKGRASDTCQACHKPK